VALRLSDAKTARVNLVGNDFSQVDEIATIDAPVSATALRIEGNVMPRSK
jgi:hypothetical protein